MSFEKRAHKREGIIVLQNVISYYNSYVTCQPSYQGNAAGTFLCLLANCLSVMYGLSHCIELKPGQHDLYPNKTKSTSTNLSHQRCLSMSLKVELFLTVTVQ